MNKSLLIVVSIILSGSAFANTNSLIEKEQEIINSDADYGFNLQLKSASPMVYDVVTDIARQKQLEEIKILLQKIADNQDKMLKAVGN